jgi:hypothetical protein
LAVATLGAYVLTRTVGLLGFQDDQHVTEAVVAVVAELVALGSLGSWLAFSFGPARPGTVASSASVRS